jgi:hypothetical protein
MQGTMLFFNETKDVGAIKSDENDERLEVRRSGFLPGHAPVGRCSGIPVVFTLTEDRLAVDVAVVEEVEHQRARRRAKR